MTASAIRLEQAPASLLEAQEKPPAPEPAPGAAQAPVDAAQASGWSEDRIRDVLGLVSAEIAAELGADMAISRTESTLLVPLIRGVLDSALPGGFATPDDPNTTIKLLAAVVLVMGVRRGLILRRRRRRAQQAAPGRPTAPRTVDHKPGPIPAAPPAHQRPAGAGASSNNGAGPGPTAPRTLGGLTHGTGRNGHGAGDGYTLAGG